MKTLKFKPNLCEEILKGSKTSTWRIFDDKDLQINDELEFVNKETLKVFGTAVITSLYNKTFRTLVDSDWEGHERFDTEEEMCKTYRTYYGGQGE
ncbi:MAG: hypothetical protein ACI9H6_000197 [Patiriisocius sp.]|jgi:hypothetical protein